MASKSDNEKVLSAFRLVQGEWLQMRKENRIPNWRGIAIGTRIVEGEEQNYVTFFVGHAPEPALEPVIVSAGLTEEAMFQVLAVGKWVALGSGALSVRSGVVSVFGLCRLGPYGAATAILERDDGTHWLLSANHVISLNQPQATVCAEIPGSGSVVLGTTLETLGIEPTNNRVDAAAVRLDVSNSLYQKFYRPLEGILCNPVPVSALQYDAALQSAPRSVVKVGPTTNQTSGLASFFNGDLTVEIDGIGECDFANITVITEARSSFGEKGDSGSLVVDREYGQPVGILFARSTCEPFFCLACYLSTALQEFASRCAAKFAVFIP